MDLPVGLDGGHAGCARKRLAGLQGEDVLALFLFLDDEEAVSGWDRDRPLTCRVAGDGDAGVHYLPRQTISQRCHAAEP